MKTFTITAAFAFLAGLAAAAPGQVQGRQGPIIYDVTATFSGAGPIPPTYPGNFLTNGHVYTISNPLSVSHISITGAPATCTFYGEDGSVTTLTNPNASSTTTADVGPPQPQVSAVCHDL